MRDIIHRTTRSRMADGAKLISISSRDLYTKSNYQDFQRFQEVDLSLAADVPTGALIGLAACDGFTGLSAASGAAAGIVSGDPHVIDRIAIGGTSGDGSTVSKSFTVTATSTVGDLLSAINGSESGYGANTLSTHTFTHRLLIRVGESWVDLWASLQFRTYLCW